MSSGSGVRSILLGLWHFNLHPYRAGQLTLEKGSGTKLLRTVESLIARPAQV
jgi:hypothetical protein